MRQWGLMGVTISAKKFRGFVYVPAGENNFSNMEKEHTRCFETDSGVRAGDDLFNSLDLFFVISHNL